MKDNLFTEVYVSTAVTTPIQLKGWVTQANPYERHGQRWHLYLSRVEILRRLAARNRKNVSPSSPVWGVPALRRSATAVSWALLAMRRS